MVGVKPDLSWLLAQIEMKLFLIVDDAPGTSKSTTKKPRTVKEVSYVLESKLSLPHL